MNRRGVRTRLIVVWSVLLLLLAGIVIGERVGWLGNRGADNDGHGRVPSRALLPVPIEEVTAIEIATAGVIHRFERSAAGDWFYHGAHGVDQAAHEHQANPASAARIAGALAGLGRARMEREFTLALPTARGAAEHTATSEANEPDYGVTVPDTLILVYAGRSQQPLARYAVGSLAPDRLSRYVHILGTQTVVTIPDYQITNLQQLVADMSCQPAARPTAQ